MSQISTTSQRFVFSVSSTLSNLLTSGKSSAASHSANLIESDVESGVNANEVSRAFEEHAIEIAAGSTLDYDLRSMSGRDVNAGTGKDALGQDLVVEEIVGLIVHKTGGSGVLEINPTSQPSDALPWVPANAAKNTLNGGINTGGLRIWFEPAEAGLDTTASACKVKFGAVGGDVEFSVYVFGRHDDDDSSSSSASSSSSSGSSESTSST